jgi:acetyltransferase AlgX (SGNH hydrolase-like protein)
MLWRFGRGLLMAAYTFLVVSLLLFSLFECFPRLLDVVNLQPIAYYALKRDLIADPALVYVLRKVNDVVRTTWKGDQYSSAYGVDVVPMPYVATTNAEGFRPNSAGPPYEIVLIGDSFLAMGEDDASTLSERLRAVSGRATFNLSRSWYGPYQYLELLKRYGLALWPKVVLLGFYAGNDIEDIREYHRWRREHRYYFYADHTQRPFLVRYAIALTDTGVYLRDTIAKRLARQTQPVALGEIHSDLGIIRVGAQLVPMVFGDWNPEGSAEQLLATAEWQALHALLTEFHHLCRAEGILPVLLYIPSKSQVYAEHATAHSGQRFLQAAAQQRPIRTNMVAALTTLAQRVELPLINLLPAFEQHAEAGRLLYYPFDTHWSGEGIQAAAEYIWQELQPWLATVPREHHPE